MQTKHQIFEAVVLGIIQQGQGSIEYNQTGAHCRYRFHKEGLVLRCAAGMLIPDEDYKVEFEDKPAYSSNFEHHNQPYLVQRYFANRYNEEACKLINNAQLSHDGNINKNEGTTVMRAAAWASSMLSIYNNYQIELPHIKEKLERVRDTDSLLLGP